MDGGGGGVWVVIAVLLIFNAPLIVYFLSISSSFLQHQAVRVVGQIAINDCFAQASSFLMTMYFSQYDSGPCQFFLVQTVEALQEEQDARYLGLYSTTLNVCRLGSDVDFWVPRIACMLPVHSVSSRSEWHQLRQIQCFAVEASASLIQPCS